MILDIILASALSLTMATQLRLPGVPIGPGEALMAIWIILSGTAWVAHNALNRKSSVPANFAIMLVFWLVFATSQAIGAINGLAFERFRDVEGFRHDIVAYALMATLSVTLIVTRPTPEAANRCIRWIVIVGTMFVLAQLATAFTPIRLGTVPWSWNRMQGWAENPNQLGLHASVLLLLAFHLLQTSNSRALKLFAATACAVIVLAGLMTRSDSFTIVLVVVIPLLVALKLHAWMTHKSTAPTLPAIAVGLTVVLTPLLVFSVAPFSPLLLNRLEQSAQSTMDDNNQAETRFKLWREAIDISLKANLIGLGPGPHLTSKDYKRPPPAKFEAHNTPLDLLTQGGLLAVIASTALLAITFALALRAQAHALAGVVLALCLFGAFHLVIRQPILWTCLALTLTYAAAPGTHAARRQMKAREPAHPILRTGEAT